MSAESISDRLERQIAARGPIPVSEYLEQALYGPGGFYMVGGRAGRRGDFLTAPEVGPLFGAVVARAVDSWWDEAGNPGSFTVVEWGAGPGTLARAVLSAAPAALTSGALRWVLVERSAAQRARHPEHAQVDSIAPEQVGPIPAGVVLANELLDNLVFDIVERVDAGWAEIRIATSEGGFVEQRRAIPSVDEPECLPATAPIGTRLPRQRAAREWLAAAVAGVARGRVVVFDYGATTAELAARDGGWLRTHVGHAGADWLIEPGSCDITADLDLDQLQQDLPADTHESQADWLRRHGIDDLVDEGRAAWQASAEMGDLAALTARSRVREAEALLDPGGMGAFHVLEWILAPSPDAGKK